EDTQAGFLAFEFAVDRELGEREETFLDIELSMAVGLAEDGGGASAPTFDLAGQANVGFVVAGHGANPFIGASRENVEQPRLAVRHYEDRYACGPRFQRLHHPIWQRQRGRFVSVAHRLIHMLDRITVGGGDPAEVALAAFLAGVLGIHQEGGRELRQDCLRLGRRSNKLTGSTAGEGAGAQGQADEGADTAWVGIERFEYLAVHFLAQREASLALVNREGYGALGLERAFDRRSGWLELKQCRLAIDNHLGFDRDGESLRPLRF